MAGSDEIGSIALIRTGSPQHGLDTDERSVELQFKQDGNTLTASAPPNGAVAPPGYYYLFVNKKSPQGLVPSVAAMVRVGGDVITAAGLVDKPAFIPMHDSSIAGNNGSATPDENSSMNDFGECTGCAKGERGGMRHDLQQSNPALKQVPIGADDDGPMQQVQQKAEAPPPTISPATNFRLVRPMLVG